MRSSGNSGEKNPQCSVAYLVAAGLCRMGYIIALAILIFVVPLLFIMLSRRTTARGGIAHRPDERGVTVSGPSSDQPTPRGDETVNQVTPGAERRLPPG